MTAHHRQRQNHRSSVSGSVEDLVVIQAVIDPRYQDERAIAVEVQEQVYKLKKMTTDDISPNTLEARFKSH